MNVVIVGASNDIEKFGNKILKDQIKRGNNVIPVHPRDEFIEKIKCYKDIQSVREYFEMVVFVVNPSITYFIISSNLEKLKGKKIWLQPGTYDMKVIELLQSNKFDYEAENCILKV